MLIVARCSAIPRQQDSGAGDYAAHPVFPAAIAAARRHAFPRGLFERFFRSMALDCAGETLACKTFDDTLAYMARPNFRT